MSPTVDRAPLPPLADLHRHLDGSLRPTTLAELADLYGIQLPGPAEELRFKPGIGLQEALSFFAVTLSVLQHPDAVKRVAAEICDDATAEGVSTLELRFAPQLHGGAQPEEIIDAALDGVDGRARLILCGLFGEDPAVLDKLVTIGKNKKDVVGIDLAGGPASNHRFSLLDYAAVFKRAHDSGLGCTVHAGEGRPAAEIRTAIDKLFASRIGHGTTLLDDASILDLIIEREITIEACLTSNHHTGAIEELGHHPLPRWLELGVKACICPDNTLLSATDSPEEHRRAATLDGMTPALLATAIANGHAGAFGR